MCKPTATNATALQFEPLEEREVLRWSPMGQWDDGTMGRWDYGTVGVVFARDG